MLIRNLNYSILQGELEHEAALEDMHMFFVAFNKRQKRIVEGLEEAKRGDASKSPRGKIMDESPNKVSKSENFNKMPIGATKSGQGTASKDGINVQLLEEEIDLE